MLTDEIAFADGRDFVLLDFQLLQVVHRLQSAGRHPVQFVASDVQTLEFPADTNDKKDTRFSETGHRRFTGVGVVLFSLFRAGERVGLDVGQPVLVQRQYLQRAHPLERVRVYGADLVVVQVEYQQPVQTLQRRRGHGAQRVLRQVQLSERFSFKGGEKTNKQTEISLDA